MPSIRCVLGVAAAFALTACDHPRSLPSGPTLRADQRAELDETELSVQGDGHYDIQGLDVQFSYEAEQEGNQKAKGEFHVRADEGGGLIVDVSGKVTCMAVDPVNHRAWIGGVVQRNASTDPDLLTDIHQHGDDIWFRVLDVGLAPGLVDRSSFIGFKGAAGIQTSAEYCAARIWPDNNARTWPVTQGGIVVLP